MKSAHSLLSLALLAGCASVHARPDDDEPDGGRGSATAASSAPVAPAPRWQRISLASTTSVRLPFELRPSVTHPHSEDAALLIADEAERAFVRRLDARGQLGPVRALDGRRAVALLESATPLLVTSDGARLCVEALDGAALPQCRALRANVALFVAGKPMLLEERLEPPPEKEEPPEPPPRRRRPKPTKPPIERVRLWLHAIEASGIAEPPIDTGVAYVRPLPGMGLLDAAGTDSGALVLHHEPTPRKPKNARLRALRLDRDGRLVPGSDTTVFDGERRFGFIEGHSEGQLFGRGGKAMYLGRFSKTERRVTVSGWEALALGPLRSVSIGKELVAIDPARLLAATALDASEEAGLALLLAAEPRLAPHQRLGEAARIAWAGPRGFFLRDDGLRSCARDGSVRDEPHPFIAARSRIDWAHFDANGAGLAATSSGFAELARDGTLLRHPAAEMPSDRHLQIAHIGETWWSLGPMPGTVGSGYGLRRLVPALDASPALELFAGSAALVGGSEHGLVLAQRGGELGIWRLGESGAIERLAQYVSPLRAGFVASERPGGGALLAGLARDGSRLVTLAMTEDGSLGASQSSGLALAGGLTLRPHPGGAWLENGKELAWLNDAAQELARSEPWPATGVCLDGRPTPVAYPAPIAGRFVAAPEGAGCTLANGFGADGSLRAFVSVAAGLDARAEVVIGPADASVLAPPSSARPPPQPSPASGGGSGPPQAGGSGERCPADMVHVAGSFCIDRYEAQLVDGATGWPLSPDYATTPVFARSGLEVWVTDRWRAGDLHAHAMPLPPLLRDPAATPVAVARSRFDVAPSGYVSGYTADHVCTAAGKRLCQHEEFLTACRGQENRDFPYGDDYHPNACNVFRFAHPAATLHGNAAVGHLDPRLNRVREERAWDDLDPHLLRRTGATPRCASRWGDDAVYDLVGNLDEWVTMKDGGGGFAGGFFSRAVRSGCEAVITVHPRVYMDYSLGVRCCRDAGP